LSDGVVRVRIVGLAEDTRLETPWATVRDVLGLEVIDRDLYRSTLLFQDPLPLHGGQVAAQALLAAGRTVPAGRLPHSLHG
jgi:acyl-CoA thioesterase-2